MLFRSHQYFMLAAVVVDVSRLGKRREQVEMAVVATVGRRLVEQRERRQAAAVVVEMQQLVQLVVLAVLAS